MQSGEDMVYVPSKVAEACTEAEKRLIGRVCYIGLVRGTIVGAADGCADVLVGTDAPITVPRIMVTYDPNPDLGPAIGSMVRDKLGPSPPLTASDKMSLVHALAHLYCMNQSNADVSALCHQARSLLGGK